MLRNTIILYHPAVIYLLKFDNRNTRTNCEIWLGSGVFGVNFEHISHLFLVFLLLTLTGKCQLGKLHYLAALTQIVSSQFSMNQQYLLVYTRVKPHSDHFCFSFSEFSARHSSFFQVRLRSFRSHLLWFNSGILHNKLYLL